MSADEESPKKRLVVAVVLTWNDVDMTARCVESVLASDYRPLHVLLVDNGSETPCGAKVQARFPSIELLVLPRNRGFTGGSNEGIRHALGMGADYVHLIGNDSTLDRQAVSLLVEALENDPTLGGASPLILYPGEEKVVQFYYGTIERDQARHVHHDDDLPVEGREWPTVKSEFVCFVAVMFRAQVLRTVGLFDESFGTCWEDYDLCLRFLDAGHPFVAVGAAEIVHLGSVTTGWMSPYITYYTTRNRLICLFRYGRPLGLLRNVLFIARSFWWQISGYGIGNFACHWAFLRGLLDFFLGVRGETKSSLDRRDRPD
jgi:hypothetical protein